MNTVYEQAIELLTSREKFHICLGLDRVSKILELLGNPQESLQIIHVAGTNGKGSTCAILERILYSAGYKTGLYTSPHIVEYTERIKINGIEISKADFHDYVFEINNLSKLYDIYLTEFELLTCCAYKYFADKEVDICVIETGLGGRLDATNVVSKNVLSVITSLSYQKTIRRSWCYSRNQIVLFKAINENPLTNVNGFFIFYIVLINFKNKKNGLAIMTKPLE